MKFLPWLVAAIAVGVASFLFIENQETTRQRDALDRRLDAVNGQLERVRAAAVALEKAQAGERAAAAALVQAIRAEMAARVAAAAAQGSERASRAAQKQAETASKAAERVAAERDSADRLAADRANLEVQRERLAIERARAEKLAVEARAAAERPRQTNAPYSTPRTDARTAAMALEAEGRGPEAIKMHIQAARGGNCDSAARLGEIYDKALLGAPRDFAESLKWYNAARVLGCVVPLSPRRDVPTS